MAIDNYEALLEKVNKIKAGDGIDLSIEEDLSIAIMNLISLEEHFFFTAQKTGKDEYLDWLSRIREMRKKLLGIMIKSYEGEVWCIAKHLLAASMRLLEVGTKMQTKGQITSAKEMFGKSYELFGLFFALRLKLIDLPDWKKEDPVGDSDRSWTKEEIMNKLLDCCQE